MQQVHTLGFSRANQSTSRVSRVHRGVSVVVRVGVYPPMVKWGREIGRGVEARSQALPNCQIALF